MTQRYTGWPDPHPESTSRRLPCSSLLMYDCLCIVCIAIIKIIITRPVSPRYGGTYFCYCYYYYNLLFILFFVFIYFFIIIFFPLIPVPDRNSPPSVDPPGQLGSMPATESFVSLPVSTSLQQTSTPPVMVGSTGTLPSALVNPIGRTAAPPTIVSPVTTTPQS